MVAAPRPSALFLPRGHFICTNELSTPSCCVGTTLRRVSCARHSSLDSVCSPCHAYTFGPVFCTSQPRSIASQPSTPPCRGAINVDIRTLVRLWSEQEGGWVWSTCAGHVCVRVPHPVLLACVGEVECVFGAPLCVCGSCGHRCCGWVRCIYVQLLAIRRVQHYTLQHRRYVACASCLGVRDARITLLCSGREVGCTIHGDHGPTVIVDMGTGAWQAPDRLDTGLCSPLLCCSGGCASTSGSTVQVCLLVASTAVMSTLS